MSDKSLKTLPEETKKDILMRDYNFKPEILKFMSQVAKNVHYNPYFVKLLENEICQILINKGDVVIEDEILRGKYFSKASVIKRLKGQINQTLKITTRPDCASIIVERPEDTYICDNPEHVYYGKKVTDYFRSHAICEKKESGMVEYKTITTSKQSAAMAPKLTHINNLDTETVIHFDENDKDIFYSYAMWPEEGYTDFQTQCFIKFGSNIMDKSEKIIKREGEYLFMDVLYENNGERSHRKFVGENTDSELRWLADWKNDWECLSVQLDVNNEKSKEGYAKVLRSKKV